MLLSHETGWRSFFFSIHVVVLVRHRFLLQSIVTILAVLTSVLVKPATQGASKPMLAVTVLALYAAVRSRRLPFCWNSSSSACARVNASVPREAFVLSEVGKPQRVALWVAKVHGRAIEELGNHERNNGVWNSPPTSSSLYL
ncbi:hypothetical protein PC114_g19155 [Phytophthora cactorum]|nr:hypothetical protein PC114_g19155 [Phytophthora cactorum]